MLKITSIEELTDQTRSTIGEFSKDIETLTMFIAQKSPGQAQERILEKLIEINKSAVKQFDIPIMDPVISKISETATNHVISKKADESLVGTPDSKYKRVISVYPKDKEEEEEVEEEKEHVSMEYCKKAANSLNSGAGRRFLVSTLEIFDIARNSNNQKLRFRATKLLCEINISVFDKCEIPLMNPALDELSKDSENKKIRKLAKKNYIDGDDLGLKNVH